MKNIRPLGWLILAFNAYYLYAFSKGIAYNRAVEYCAKYKP